MHHAGVVHPRVLRGLAFSVAATASNLGMADVRFVRAEGQAMGAAARKDAMAAATLAVKALDSDAADQPRVSQVV